MNAISTRFGKAAASAMLSADVTSMRWAALGDAARIVAELAGEKAGIGRAEQHDFPALLNACPAWKRDLVERSVADLAAIMQPGIATLLSVQARGADSGPAAQALWYEYVTARDAIIALVINDGAD